MNKPFGNSSLFLGLILLSFSHSSVLASDDWKLLQNKSILKELLSGKGLDGTDFADFYRKDGVMGYYNKAYDSTVVRIWKIKDGGEICTYIYVKPDRLVECYTLAQSSADPKLLQMTILDRGYKVQARLVTQPLQSLVDKVNSTVTPKD